MSDVIPKLLAAFQENQLTAKPKVKQAQDLVGGEKVTGDEVNQSWKLYMESKDQPPKPDQAPIADEPSPRFLVNADEVDVSTECVEALFVKTIPGVKSFRRAGFSFNSAGYGIALDALTEEQITAIKGEKNLISEECEMAEKVQG